MKTTLLQVLFSSTRDLRVSYSTLIHRENVPNVQHSRKKLPDNAFYKAHDEVPSFVPPPFLEILYLKSASVSIRPARKTFNHAEGVYGIRSLSAVWNHHKVMYGIKPKEDARQSVMPYAYGDYILTCGEMPCQSFGLDRK